MALSVVVISGIPQGVNSGCWMWNCSSSLWISDLDFQVKKASRADISPGPPEILLVTGARWIFQWLVWKTSARVTQGQRKVGHIREAKCKEAALPHTLKIRRRRSCSFAELSNSNSILLWDEGEKYFPDFPLYVFIITAALNFSIGKKEWGFLSLYSPSTNSL